MAEEITRTVAPPMQPMSPEEIARLKRLDEIDATRPTVPSRLTPVHPEAPSLGGTPAEPKLLPIASPAGPPSLSRNEIRRLPTVSPGAPAGSAASYEAQLEKLQAPRPEPTTRLQRIGGVLSKIGNIAGDILAPGVTAMIPGSDLNRAAQIREIEPKLAEARKEEASEATAKAKQGLEERKETSQEEGRQQRDEETLAKQGLMRDEQGNIVADPTSQVYQKNQLGMQTVQNLQKYRDAQTELAQARTEVERAKNDPNSPAFKAAQERLAMAAEAHRVAAANLGLHEQEFANKKEEQEFVKPSGQTVSRGDAAGAALKLIPGLENDIKAHAAEFGPVVGRIARGEIAIGNAPPEVQKFYAELQSFYSLQPAIHGFRNAEFVKDFNTFVGNLQTKPDSLLAGLEGLKPTLTEVEKSGRTYKKRIKEGESEAPSAGGTPAAVDPNDPLGLGLRKKQ